MLECESEWYYRQEKWDALDQIFGHTTSAPILNWVAEKERIEELSWWGDVMELLKFREWAVYFLQPVGIIGQFKQQRFIFTLETMKAIFRNVESDRDGDLREIIDELNAHIDFDKLDTHLRRAHFFAQITQEAGEMLKTNEEFTYSSNRLKEIFRNFRNNPEKADIHEYIRKAGAIKNDGTAMTIADHKAIANYAYAGVNGNGDVASGDGWRFRGRGLKQLTGRENYSRLQEWHERNLDQWPNDKINFIDTPDLLIEMKYATRSALYFWLKNKLYEKADMGSRPNTVDEITKIINLHTDSYTQRKLHFERIWEREILK